MKECRIYFAQNAQKRMMTVCKTAKIILNTAGTKRCHISVTCNLFQFKTELLSSDMAEMACFGERRFSEFILVRRRANYAFSQGETLCRKMLTRVIY